MKKKERRLAVVREEKEACGVARKYARGHATDRAEKRVFSTSL